VVATRKSEREGAGQDGGDSLGVKVEATARRAGATTETCIGDAVRRRAAGAWGSVLEHAEASGLGEAAKAARRCAGTLLGDPSGRSNVDRDGALEWEPTGSDRHRDDSLRRLRTLCWRGKVRRGSDGSRARGRLGLNRVGRASYGGSTRGGEEGAVGERHGLLRSDAGTERLPVVVGDDLGESVHDSEPALARTHINVLPEPRTGRFKDVAARLCNSAQFGRHSLRGRRLRVQDGNDVRLWGGLNIFGGRRGIEWRRNEGSDEAQNLEGKLVEGRNRRDGGRNDILINGGV